MSCQGRPRRRPALATHEPQRPLAQDLADAVNEVLERHGPEHPWLDILIEQRLAELLDGS